MKLNKKRDKKILLQEEEEEREINENYLRLEYMKEECSRSDLGIWRLIEEQQEMLSVLKMKRNELFDD